MNITGFNPTLAASNIRQFAEEVEKVYEKLQEAIGDLSFELADNWASANAVKFRADIKPLFDNLFQTMNDKSVEIQHGAYAAYNYAASANGASTITDDTQGFFDATDFAELFESKDGNVGMNIAMVRDTILPKFENRMNNCADAIGSITSSIALYDTEDGQQRAYASGISSMKEMVVSILDATKKSLTTALENEANVVFQGAQSALSDLS